MNMQNIRKIQNKAKYSVVRCPAHTHTMVFQSSLLLSASQAMLLVQDSAFL